MPRSTDRRHLPRPSRSRRPWPPVRTPAVVGLGLALLAAWAAPAAYEPAGRATAPGAGAPDCGWTPGFEGRDLDSPVRALAVYDDGTGPALYAGGEFATAGAAVVHQLARWDGAAWSAVGGGMGGSLDSGATLVMALAAFDDGGGPALYAGGDFTTAGGVTVNGLARWDGAAWSALSGPSGTGTNGPVAAIALYDDGSGPALYAAGNFATAGGVVVNGVAKWDGAAWSALSGPAGTGVAGGSGTVRALTVYDDGTGPALYAGGSFATAGGVTVNGVAKWDGAAWSALAGPAGTGVSSIVFGVTALAVHDDGGGPALYAGGLFATAGGVAVNNVAKWNGGGWSALSGPAGTGTDTAVRALAVWGGVGGPALYVGGSFTTAGGLTVNNVARWDGGAWSALGGPAGTGVPGSVEALAVHDDGTGPALYAGGGFSSAGGLIVNNVGRWDGAWSELSATASAGMDNVGAVHALAVYDDGGGPALYAGGAFIRAGGATVNTIARWDGEGWSALAGPAGIGVTGGVVALAVFDDGSGPALYAGGTFVTAGGVTVNNVAKWDGFAWSALSGPGGPGTNSAVFALAVFDDGGGPALYAGGHFTTAGGIAAFRIAKWDGATWSALSGPAGNGTIAGVFALAVFDDGGGPALYAGGDFTTAGGVTVNRVAQWDGTAWSALVAPGGIGTSDPVRALAVFDDGGGARLYAGGHFVSMGGVPVGRVAEWDGGGWSALSGPAGNGTDDPVYRLSVYDDVDGPGLHAGGEFSVAGGLTSGRLARWDGAAWSTLAGPAGTGLDGSFVNALAVYDDGDGPALYVGGLFRTAGGVPSRNVARWLCTAQIFADGFESGDTTPWSATVP